MKSMTAAIDFGTSKVVTLVAASGGYRRFDIVGAGVAAYDGFIDGAWNNEAKLEHVIRQSIEAAERQSGKRVKEIHVGVPGEFSRVYVTECKLQLQGVDPHVTSADVDRIFQMAEEEIQPVRGVIVHRSPAWFMVDEGKKTMEPVGQKGSVLRSYVSFIVADEFFLKDVNAKMQRLNIEVTGFFSTPMGEALLFLPEDERERICVLIDVGYLSCEVMAVEGDALVFHKSLPVGGAHIAMDLALGLNTQMAVAEQIKRGYSFGMAGASDTLEAVGEGNRPQSFAREDVQRVLEPRVDEIAELIAQCLESSGVRLGNWSNIYLTGGGIAMMRGGREYLSSQLERPVRAPAAKAANLNSPIYSSALGLIDLIYGTIEQQEEGGGLFDRVRSTVQGLFRR